MVGNEKLQIWKQSKTYIFSPILFQDYFFSNSFMRSDGNRFLALHLCLNDSQLECHWALAVFFLMFSSSRFWRKITLRNIKKKVINSNKQKRIKKIASITFGHQFLLLVRLLSCVTCEKTKRKREGKMDVFECVSYCVFEIRYSQMVAKWWLVFFFLPFVFLYDL